MSSNGVAAADGAAVTGNPLVTTTTSPNSEIIHIATITATDTVVHRLHTL